MTHQRRYHVSTTLGEISGHEFDPNSEFRRLRFVKTNLSKSKDVVVTVLLPGNGINKSKYFVVTVLLPGNGTNKSKDFVVTV